MIRDYLLITMRNLKGRKVRSWLTVIGIIIGVATIIALISISAGMENAIQYQFDRLGVKNIRVTPGKMLMGPPTGETGLTTADVETISRIKEVEEVTGVLSQYGNIKFKNQDRFSMIMGYPAEKAADGIADVSADIASGRTFRPNDRYVVLMGYKMAKDAFDDEIRVKNSIYIEEHKFEVIGIFEESGTAVDSQVLIPFETAKDLFGTGDTVNVILAEVREGFDSEEVAEEIEFQLARARNDENFQVFTPQQLLDQVKAVLGAVSIVLIAIASISIVVGAVGIMNSMFTSVLERRKEVGIMKSIGAKNIDILLVFVTEAAIIGLVGGLAGALLGSGIGLSVEVIAKQFDFPFLKVTVDVWLIIGSLLLAMIVGMIAGVVPAMQAASLHPVDVLRYE